MKSEYLIVGAGHAGRRMAESLRELLPAAGITLVGEEPHLPYDRPPLSKEGLIDENAIQETIINDRDFYQENNISLLLDTIVQAIDPKNKIVDLGDNKKIQYEKLILTTGSKAKKLSVEGLTEKDIFYLRTIDDSRNLRAAAQNKKNILVIGGGFIGLEVAATLSSQLKVGVTVLESNDRVLKRVMPKELSTYIENLHEKKGVSIKLNTRIESAEKRGDVYLIKTNHGPIECDLIIAGIGASPNQELAEKAGIAVDNGILVDEFGQTSLKDIYAAGDVTAHFSEFYNKNIRLESWQIAENQPEALARYLAGEDDAKYNELPWLWSDHYEFNFQLLGDFAFADKILIRQEDEAHLAIIGLNADNQLKAVCTINQGRDMSMYRRLMQKQCAIPTDQLTDISHPIRALRSLLK